MLWLNFYCSIEFYAIYIVPIVRSRSTSVSTNRAQGSVGSANSRYSSHPVSFLNLCGYPFRSHNKVRSPFVCLDVASACLLSTPHCGDWLYVARPHSRGSLSWLPLRVGFQIKGLHIKRAKSKKTFSIFGKGLIFKYIYFNYFLFELCEHR